MQIGRRIYFDKETGNVILDKGEMSGSVIKTTPEQDREVFAVLNERLRSSYDFIELDYGQYAQDFAECNGYRVNVETGALEFSYPVPGEEVPQEPVYQQPLTEQIADLKSDMDNAILELTTIIAMGGGI